MALTDRSAIPLNVNDLRVVEGERCFEDRRIGLRLGYKQARYIRDLIKNNREDFEARFGPLRHRAAVVRHPQGGSTEETQYWLTKGQALWVCRKSDARNADDVMEEVIKVFLAVDAGAPIPDTPWTDALFTPDRPTIVRGDDNVVHVEPPEVPEQECRHTVVGFPKGQIDLPLDNPAGDRTLDDLVHPYAFADAEIASPSVETWIETHEGINYEATWAHHHDGTVSVCVERAVEQSKSVGWGALLTKAIAPLLLNGGRLKVLVGHYTPREVVSSALAKKDELTPLVNRTIAHFYD
jgi:hypothetical protein